MNVLTLLKMPLQTRGGDQSLLDAYGMFLSASPLPDNVTPITNNARESSLTAVASARASKVRVNR